MITPALAREAACAVAEPMFRGVDKDEQPSDELIALVASIIYLTVIKGELAQIAESDAAIRAVLDAKDAYAAAVQVKGFTPLKKYVEEKAR
jgi:hypothetical protein